MLSKIKKILSRFLPTPARTFHAEMRTHLEVMQQIQGEITKVQRSLTNIEEAFLAEVKRQNYHVDRLERSLTNIEEAFLAEVKRQNYHMDRLVCAAKLQTLHGREYTYLVPDYYNEPLVEGDVHSKKALSTALTKQVTNRQDYLLTEMNGAIRIVFVVHLLSAFSAIESIYCAMEDDKRFDPLIVLTPWMQPGMLNNEYRYDAGIEAYMADRNYHYVWAYRVGKWTDIYAFKPDGVFFQTPYYEQRPIMYAIEEKTDGIKILYTPYGPWIMDRSVEAYIHDGLYPRFFDPLWRAFVDTMSYEIMEWAAPQYVEKTILTGSPKVDFHLTGLNSTRYCWKNLESSLKKIIWLPRWGIAEDRTSFLDYYEYFIELINQGRVEFVVRPHPLLWKDLERTNTFTSEELNVIIAAFERPENSVIDYNADYREGLLSCDFLVMDFSSIIYEYLPTGKPVIYTPKDNTLVDARIMSACYVARSETEIQRYVDMLLNDEDPLKEKRERIIKELDYFPHGKPNGEYIKDYIAEHIREDI